MRLFFLERSACIRSQIIVLFMTSIVRFASGPAARVHIDPLSNSIYFAVYNLTRFVLLLMVELTHLLLP